MFSLKIFMIIMLSFLLMILAVSPANASTDSSSAQRSVVYKSNLGNQFVEISKDGKKSFVVVSAPVTYNDLSDKSKLRNMVKSNDQEVVGQRSSKVGGL